MFDVVCRIDEVADVEHTSLAFIARRLLADEALGFRVEVSAGVEVEVGRSEHRVPGGRSPELGELPIGIHLHSEVNAEVVVRVVPAE